jgi:hypothetical protein
MHRFREGRITSKPADLFKKVWRENSQFDKTTFFKGMPASGAVNEFPESI